MISDKIINTESLNGSVIVYVIGPLEVSETWVVWEVKTISKNIKMLFASIALVPSLLYSGGFQRLCDV